MLCINFRKINSDLLRYKEVVCNEDNIIINVRQKVGGQVELQ